MKHTLRILHLENNGEDHLLAARKLADEGLECTFTRVETGTEFEFFLRQNSCDLILSEYSFPGVSGLQALAVARQARPEVPFVFLSNYSAADDIVESLKCGAADYVRKQHLDRLGLAVTRALQEAHEHQALVQAKALLTAENERLAVTLSSIGDGIITTDTEGRVELINAVAERLTGWTRSQAIGRQLEEVFHIRNTRTNDIAPNPAKQALKNDQIVGLPGRTALIAPDGTERYVSSSSAPIKDLRGKTIGVVLVFRDVSERQRSEEETLKIQKLESLGILAGGIAHDFNNILTSIIGNISLAKMEEDDFEAIYELLNEAESAALRAKDLTQQLLTFSKGGAPIKRTASLAEIMEETASFALRGSNVGCQFHIAPDLWPVEVDVGQINQVLNNLIINADQAMPEGGQIVITAENIAFNQLDKAIPLKPANYVRVSVQDEGIGIPQKNLLRIFDPYFTTKQRGSGLGLATCFAIIKKHEGHIAVKSELGSGSTFTIYLPATPAKAVLRETGDTGLKEGRGKILLMDDDKMIRDLAQKILRRIGYDVAVASEGSEAIEVYQQALDSNRRFDLVIMDLTIPGGLGGKETIARLLKIDPNVKAMVASGYSNDPIMADYKAHHFKGVITKPFKVEELSQKVLEIINS